MSTEQNKVVVRRLIDEVSVAGKYALMDDLAVIGFIDHHVNDAGEDTNSIGIENYIRVLQHVRAAFPDLSIDVVQILAEGDLVTAHLRVRGTHLGELWGIPASGRRIDFREINIIRVVNGKCTDRWSLADRYTLFQQLGTDPGK